MLEAAAAVVFNGVRVLLRVVGRALLSRCSADAALTLHSLRGTMHNPSVCLGAPSPAPSASSSSSCLLPVAGGVKERRETLLFTPFYLSDLALWMFNGAFCPVCSGPLNEVRLAPRSWRAFGQRARTDGRTDEALLGVVRRGGRAGGTF